MYTSTHREGRDSKKQAAGQSRGRLRQRRHSQMQQIKTHARTSTHKAPHHSVATHSHGAVDTVGTSSAIRTRCATRLCKLSKINECINQTLCFSVKRSIYKNTQKKKMKPK